MPMAPGDLVTLRDVKAWLAIDAAKVSSDQLLTRLIRVSSAMVLNYCNRNTPFGWTTVTETHDGNGRNSMVLREAPASDVLSVDLGNGTILTTTSTGSPPSSGFLLETTPGDEQRTLVLVGYTFPRGRANITVTYRAGYRVQGETQIVPPTTSSTPLQVTAFLGWSGDLGVTINGAALVAVSGAPATMQYAVVDGVYSFNAAQAGATVSLSYQLTPDDVGQAVIEIIGERYKTASRIGEVSHAMGGSTNMTTTFSQKPFNDFVASLLQPYKKVVPA